MADGVQAVSSNQDREGHKKERDFVQRASDPAFVTGLLLAAFYFAGWTYYDAYLLRLGLNPAGFSFASVTVGVKGASAMLITLAALMGGTFPVLIAALLVVSAGSILRRFRIGRWRKDVAPEPGRLSPVIIPTSFVASAVLVVLAAGPYAGKIKALDDLALVTKGDGWDYHLRNAVVRGIPVMQNNDRVWLLTRAGVRPIKADDILLQDGPLFERVKTTH